jgi:hypothetical protein
MELMYEITDKLEAKRGSAIRVDRDTKRNADAIVAHAETALLGAVPLQGHDDTTDAAVWKTVLERVRYELVYY